MTNDGTNEWTSKQRRRREGAEHNNNQRNAIYLPNWKMQNCPKTTNEQIHRPYTMMMLSSFATDECTRIDKHRENRPVSTFHFAFRISSSRFKDFYLAKRKNEEKKSIITIVLWFGFGYYYLYLLHIHGWFLDSFRLPYNDVESSG